VLTLALALVLGVGSAGGRVATITTLTVEVIGQGEVTSTPSGIKCGNGKDDCYVAFSGGGSVDLNASPASNWSFEDWGATYDTDCNGDTGDCIIPLDGGTHVVTANFQGPSTGTSTLTVNYEGQGYVQGGNILCGALGGDPTASPPDPPTTVLPACTWSVLTGSTLTVHEVPDTTTNPGFVFAGWAGSCKQVDDACTITMDANRQITATWVPSTDITTLSVDVAGSGRVTGNGITCHGPGSCTENEPKNSSVTLHAEPDDGYMFTGWTAPGDCVGAGDTCNLTMDTARSVTATFAPAVNLGVTVSGNGNVSGGAGAINCGNGGVICSANVAQNATVTLIATPALGSTFTGWTGACGGAATSCTVLMNQSKSVTATFGIAAGGFLLTVSVSGPGSVNGPGISCGNGATVCSATPTTATVTLTATPAAGATFGGWGGACTAVVPTCTVQMTAARSVTAAFTTGGGGGPTVPLAVSVVGSGTVSGGGIQCGNSLGACSVSVPTGSAVTLTATPTAGASFTSWGGACSGSAPTCTVSMTSAKTVSATFSAAAPGTLAITVQGRGTVSAPLGKCIGAGATKTCIQKYAAGRTLTLTAAAAAGNTFAGWAGACFSAARRVNCPITLNAAKSVTARFVPVTARGGGGGVSRAVLTSLGPPIVRHTTTGFRVTLRFDTTRAGVARVTGLRAGRIGARVTFHIAAGPARVGPFTVTKPGFYTFQVRLGTSLLQWRVCLGRCGPAAPGPPFVFVGKPPTVTRSGDAWSVTLHAVSNQIAVARVRAVKGGKVLFDQNFLARAGDVGIGPFLLGPGSYTLRLNATDAYGRTRSLIWVVALAQ
jgi:uncharacterized repeat protein (TIGR02543 family)